jgi:hypothetical protein
VTTNEVGRPFLESELDGGDYFKAALGPHHQREFRRLERRLADTGRPEHHIAREEEEVRHGVEAFLSLEVADWKGRERTGTAIDRCRAAFAREAVFRMSERTFAAFTRSPWTAK